MLQEIDNVKCAIQRVQSAELERERYRKIFLETRGRLIAQEQRVD